MSHRLPRIEQAIQQALAEIIQQRLRDPRLPMMLTITRVGVTKDLAQCRVSFSQLPDDQQAIDDSLEALEAARGFLRNELARSVKLRAMPALEFFYDDSGRKSQRVNELLNQWKEETKKNAPPTTDGEDEGEGEEGDEGKEKL